MQVIDLAKLLHKAHSLAVNAARDRREQLDFSRVDWDAWWQANADMPLSGPGFVKLWTDCATEILSAFATEALSRTGAVKVPAEASKEMIEDGVLAYNLTGVAGDVINTAEDHVTFIWSAMAAHLSDLEPAAPEGQQPVASVTGSSLAFSDGVLHVNKDGSGHIVVSEEHFEIEVEYDSEDGGRFGFWVARFPPGEMQAIKDFLNRVSFIRPSEPPVTDWPRGTRIRVEHDGFEGVVLGPYVTLEGKRGQVCQLAGAQVVHVYGEKWLQRVDEVDAAPPITAARPLEEWHEDHGFAVWWTWRDGDWLGEPSYVGSPLCDDWPGYHTHWTPHPTFPVKPAACPENPA